MTSKRIAQTNQQQKSEKPQESGILQRAAVHPVSDTGMQSTDDKEAQPLSNSTFSKDFSRVPISTTKPQQIMAKLMVSPVLQQKNTSACVQLRDRQAIQREMSEVSSEGIGASEKHKENKTGLPDRMKTGAENEFGYSLDNVRVHYNSPKPAQLQAYAYAQGTDIYVAPRQERHIGHEVGHIFQQMQGKVKPTSRLAKGVAINDDPRLEKEADAMASKFENYNPPTRVKRKERMESGSLNKAVEKETIQRRVGFEFENLSHSVISSNSKEFQNGYEAAKKNDKIDNFLKKFNRPKRKEVIIKGENFTLEADDTLPKHATIEFVVPKTLGFNFDERDKLETTIKEVVRIATKIGKRGQEHPGFWTAKDLSSAATGDYIIHLGTDDRYVVQATAGIGITKLTSIMNRTDDDELRLGFENGFENLARAAVSQAEKAMEEVGNDMQNFPTNGREELTNLLSLMVVYIKGAMKKQSNFKNITPLMARTSFAGLFNLIDEGMKQYLRQSPETWEKLVDKACLLKGNYSETAFEHQEPGDEGDYYYLSINKWIMEFTKLSLPTDLLKDFDSSMGEFGNKVDKGRQGQEQPIFEFRKLAPATPANFLDRALKFFDYIVRVNEDHQ